MTEGGPIPSPGYVTRVNDSGQAIPVMAPAPHKCLARWQRLGDEHLHKCESVAGHAPPHRCSEIHCQAIAVEPERSTAARW